MLNQSVILTNNTKQAKQVNLIKSICIKNSELESLNINKTKLTSIQKAKILGEMIIMLSGLVDLRKYDRF